MRSPEKSLSLENKKMLDRIVLIFLSVCKNEKNQKTSEGRNEEKTKIQRGKHALKLVFITGINLPLHCGLRLRFL